MHVYFPKFFSSVFQSRVQCSIAVFFTQAIKVKTDALHALSLYRYFVKTVNVIENKIPRQCARSGEITVMRSSQHMWQIVVNTKHYYPTEVKTCCLGKLDILVFHNLAKNLVAWFS